MSEDSDIGRHRILLEAVAVLRLSSSGNTLSSNKRHTKPKNRRAILPRPKERGVPRT